MSPKGKCAGRGLTQSGASILFSSPPSPDPGELVWALIPHGVPGLAGLGGALAADPFCAATSRQPGHLLCCHCRPTIRPVAPALLAFLFPTWSCWGSCMLGHCWGQRAHALMLGGWHYSWSPQPPAGMPIVPWLQPLGSPHCPPGAQPAGAAAQRVPGHQGFRAAGLQ